MNNSAIQSAGDLAITQATSPPLASRLGRTMNRETIDKSAKDFEGMFMAQMLQPMFETVGVDKIFGGGHGEETMRGFLVQEYGKALSKASHFGIADAVRAEMIRGQEKKNALMSSTGNEGAANAVGSIQ